MLENVLKLVASHLIGDYVLQCDFIAKSKGENWYHLFVHCFLYCVPFSLTFGIDLRLMILFVSHIIIDAMKARYHKISYAEDQWFHYVIASILYMR